MGIVFVGKFAEWKRQAALLHAASQYEKAHPDVVTLCVGTGPEEEATKLKGLCDQLGLKNTFLLGARGQDILAELYTVMDLGVFPSFKEPFGLVFVECMACRTPVIGANSGGPKDFVSKEVGELVQEPPETHDLSTVSLGIETLGKTLNETICRALKEDWKKSKGPACIKLAHDRFTVEAQVSNMIKDAQALPPPEKFRDWRTLRSQYFAAEEEFALNSERQQEIENMYDNAAAHDFKGAGDWDGKCSSALKDVSKFTGKASLLIKDKYTGVSDAVSKLNAPGETFACVEGYCVVYSQSHEQYFLLYRPSKKTEAYEVCNLED